MPTGHAAPERRHSVRLGTIWIGLVVFVAGNVADWFGWISWGPEQTDPGQRYWVLASALGFWIAASTLLTLVVDSVILLSLGSVPSYRELTRGGPIQRFTNRIREQAERYHALIGAGGLFLGAVVGHLIWKP